MELIEAPFLYLITATCNIYIGFMGVFSVFFCFWQFRTELGAKVRINSPIKTYMERPETENRKQKIRLWFRISSGFERSCFLIFEHSYFRPGF